MWAMKAEGANYLWMGTQREKDMSKTVLSKPDSVWTQEIYEMIDIGKIQKIKTKKNPWDPVEGILFLVEEKRQKDSHVITMRHVVQGIKHNIC